MDSYLGQRRIEVEPSGEFMSSFQEITRENFDAVLFDLDGVLTATAKLHAAAWKQTFDHFLQRAETREEAFVSFDIGQDYRQYIDDKLRRLCPSDWDSSGYQQ
jgi:hypothetical protein